MPQLSTARSMDVNQRSKETLAFKNGMHSRNLISTFANIIFPLKRVFFQEGTSSCPYQDALVTGTAWPEVPAEVQN